MYFRVSWQQKVAGSLVGLLLVVAGLWLTPMLARSQDGTVGPAQADQRLQALQQQAGQSLVTAYRATSAETDHPPLRFWGVSKDQPLPVALEGAEANAAAGDPERMARAFLRQSGDLFWRAKRSQRSAHDAHLVGGR
jgi:hypothetical protein